MSADVIATIITAAGLLVTLSGGYLASFAWLSRRMDERFDKIDERFDKVDERLHGIEVELNEVKIAVARLEGPTPRLIYPR